MFPVICFHRPFSNPVYEESISSASGDLAQRAWLRLWKTFIIIIIARVLFFESFPFASALLALQMLVQMGSGNAESLTKCSTHLSPH